MPILRRAWVVAALWGAACASRPAAIPPADPYVPVARALEEWIGREIKDKGIPALSVALVDDQEIVWARGFGEADAETIHRAGSVSKLMTDVAVMQLVERGELDLDAPVERVLPGFAPRNPHGTPITLRQMMAHRSGLVREPPRGSYFDAEPRGLEDMVRSLNETALVYAPGTRTKYSNAAVATVGRVLEVVRGEPFADAVRSAVLEPCGMARSGFTPPSSGLARAVMWTSFGREFPAPTFELGIAPAGSLYAPVTDLARFMSVLFAGGRGPGGQVLRPETLEQMWTPQFAPASQKRGFGLGFMVGEIGGQRTVGHDGAVYGFATRLVAMPGRKLGVAVAASKDCANSLTDRIGEVALRLMLDARDGRPLPPIERTEPLGPAEARRLAGWYEADGHRLHLVEDGGRLFLHGELGEFRVEVRSLGGALVVDDCLAYGLRIDLSKARRVPEPRPAPAPERWMGLIGEYGWDHNILTILERDGALFALIEWFFLYPLKEESPERFAFPDYGLYHGEKIVFALGTDGRATQATAASVVFPRRRLEGEGAETFRIVPVRPVEEIRREAAVATPPREKGDFLPPDLVEPAVLEPGIKLDIRYAGTNNFMSARLYASARAFLQRPAAEALVRAHRALAAHGYGVLIHDGYRPWAVTKMFWEATPPAQRVFVADPSKGSRHNRGCAVDLTLYELSTGRPVGMVGLYDEMGDRSWPDYPGGTSLQRWQRDLLRRSMEAEGFSVYENEWWHFDFAGWRRYPILNVPFERLGK